MTEFTEEIRNTYRQLAYDMEEGSKKLIIIFKDEESILNLLNGKTKP